MPPMVAENAAAIGQERKRAGDSTVSACSRERGSSESEAGAPSPESASGAMTERRRRAGYDKRVIVTTRGGVQ
jgi:hypothetical protein